jgi:hypothetical protein
VLEFWESVMGENGKRARIGVTGLGMVLFALAVFGAYVQAGSAPVATIAHGEVPQQALPAAAK